VLGPGDEPIVKSGQTKTRTSRPLATGLHVHTHMCTLTARSAHIQTHTVWHMNSTRAG